MSIWLELVRADGRIGDASLTLEAIRTRIETFEVSAAAEANIRVARQLLLEARKHVQKAARLIPEASVIVADSAPPRNNHVQQAFAELKAAE